MKKQENPAPGWAPEFELDLGSATAQQFIEVVDGFDASTKALGANLPPLPFTANDWQSLDAQVAEACLRRNRPGSNRKLSFATVVYYWAQMRDGLWPKTGQAIIFDVEGWATDGQHRLWACYLGRVKFDTYVIIDAPVIENVFAFIDNVKVRTPAAALQTAKFNGLSSVISQTIQIASNYDIGAYTCYKTKHVSRMAPIQYLNYAKGHPGLKAAVRLVVADHKEAMEMIGHKDVATFAGYKIISLWNEETAERFFEELAFPSETHSDSEPLRTLRTFLAKQAKTDTPLPKHLVLAYLINAFNGWVTGTSIKKISVAADDPFPQFAEPDKSETAEDQEAA